MKSKIVDIVKEFVQDNPDLNHSGVAELIQKSGKINRSHRTIRLYVAEVREMLTNGDLDDIVHPDVDSLDSASTPTNFVATQVPPDTQLSLDLEGVATSGADTTVDKDQVVYSGDEYEIFYPKTPTYILSYSSTSIEIAVGIVDKAFLAHSRSGLNLTEQQTVRLLDLTEIEFKAMKARLALCKDSDSVGPYTTEIHTPEEIFDLIGNYSSQLLNELSDVDDPVRATLIRETKKQLILAQNKNILFKSFIKELKEQVGTIKLRSLSKAATPDATSSEISAVISDLHLGVISDKFDLKIAEQKLAEVAEHINQFSMVRPDVSVNVILPGDIMHNISGYMHADAFKHTETGMWGAESIIKPYELLLNFLLSITGLKAVYVVGGNHDRMNAEFKRENTAEGAKLLSYMLSSTLPSEINVQFDSRIIKFNSGELRYIIQHGDLKADKKSKVEEVVWEHGQKDKFNIVLTGHHHTRIIARGDDTYRAIRMSVPGFSPSDDYAKDCGYSNNPGILIFQEKGGRPAIVDIPLIY
jgi:predicted phosphodiesterase